ncbi:NIL domain-containing protein [Dethiosulfatarculus sandiegensis]|uniref:(Fe-S)-binding protein n=1 Tax=Dethiosulfatarculus sandiegensis TaxID=1429043 RepID=A0A0D2K066_9BACT|nr:NIL domain-containing protein [Dethiosulfatarculus sandiegensis]KIX15130.1 (Fe-S)-binding protein [Dethiosulfatarculus sandiegensis]
MAKKKVIFSFPPTLIEEPVTYKLVKSYDLQVNILRARVVPREKGRMVVELKGTPENLEKAFDYLETQGVQIDTMIQEMRHHTDRCVHCTACTAACPTGALSVDQETREVSFDASLCIICEACIPVCSYEAIESLF